MLNQVMNVASMSIVGEGRLMKIDNAEDIALFIHYLFKHTYIYKCLSIRYKLFLHFQCLS